MRIGINLLYLIPGQVYGTRTYAVSLIRSLAEIDRENEYYVFVNQESRELDLTDASNVHRVVCGFYAKRRAIRCVWEQAILPIQLYSYGIEVVHSLGYVGPLLPPCSSVVTIPDLNYIALKNTLPAGKRVILQLFSMQAARRADHVITISNFSKREISQVLNLNLDRITVTHLGARRDGNTKSLNNWADVRGRYGINEPYVVAFGGGTLHKNIPRLIQAFAIVRETFPHGLVLIGQIPSNVDLSAESMDKSMRDRITTTGYVPGAHIQPLLSHADLFVLPSLYEGFGLPVVEAQQAGVAVSCSSAGSLPEVGGEGAVYFDPTSVESIAETIKHCLADADLRSQLILKGQENVKRFSWEKTARETLSVYQSVYQSTM